MDESEQIRALLKEHPDLTTVEDVLDKCKEQGIEAGLWTVYFLAKDSGRRLSRRPLKSDDGQDLRELALILLGLHKGMGQAFETLDNLQPMNEAGTRVPWERESTETQYGWELSVAQEFVDRAGSFAMARHVLRSL